MINWEAELAQSRIAEDRVKNEGLALARAWMARHQSHWDALLIDWDGNPCGLFDLFIVRCPQCKPLEETTIPGPIWRRWVREDYR